MLKKSGAHEGFLVLRDFNGLAYTRTLSLWSHGYN